MILVLPFCAKDGELAIKNLEWIRELDPKLPYHCLISWDTETPKHFVNAMTTIAGSVFEKVTPMWYPAPQKKHWPAAANWAFQEAARYVAHFFPKESWLFLEPDATPIRGGWLQQLETEHIKGGKPFTAHVVDGMGHPNGVAIYPGLVALFSQDAMRVEETAWDVVLGATVDKNMIHSANDIIRHCWNMDEKTGECTNGHGISPTFRSVHEVVRKVDLNASLYHRCKDGSLIHWLREFYKAPHKAMVPDHTGYEESDHQSRMAEGKAAGREAGVGNDATTVSAEPIQSDSVQAKETEVTHDRKESKPATAAKTAQVVEASVESGGAIPSGVDASAGAELVAHDSSKPEAAIPKTEIFIVTYGKDFPWLEWCLKCLRKHATGFTGITLAIPNTDASKLQPIANEHAQSKSGIPLRIKMFSERPGKGMLTHMVVMAHAEEFVPKDTQFVVHLDADCMFHMPSTPNDWFVDGKPVYVIRTWDSLVDGKGVVSDCAQWRAPTETQLGFASPWYTMCRLGSVFPVGFYKPYRDHVTQTHGKPYEDFMLSGKNSFPQDRMDWTAMGVFAKHKMEQAFHWINIDVSAPPKDRFKVYWSHGGCVPDIQKEIEGFLK